MEEQTKRLLLAIGISFAFIFLWQTYFMPAPPPPAEEPVTASEVAPTAPAQILATPAAAPAQTILPIRAESERTITVRTPLYTAVVTNRGAGIKSFTLSGFEQDPKNPGSHIEMVRLLPEGSAPPLASEFTGIGGPLGLNTALFASESKDMDLARGGRGDVLLKVRTPEGVEMVRTLSFSGDDYSVRVATRLVNAGQRDLSGKVTLDWNAGLEAPLVGTKDKSFAASKYAYSGAVYFQDGKTRKFKAKKLKEPVTLDRAPDWISSQDVYFVAALLPGTGISGGHARTGPDGRVQVGLTAQVALPPGGGADLMASAYIGPKEAASLAAVDPSLERTIELGMFSIIARPLLALLKFFYKYVPNYGVAIILLTILIKVIFIPFTNISHRSMKKMSQLQPQINALRDRYKKDRDKLNQEIMALYKENKVNPAGGCLPMLAQIPVFFALYKALLGAIELRHAPFAFWITDLSAKDPFYITPVIMGATMVIQQKMTPTSMDPRQAQLMMFLPIVFTAMFLSFPSGLVLYWLMNNVLTIGHQYLLNRADGGAVPATPVKEKGRKR